MNILERKAWLTARDQILYYLNKDPPTTNIVEYLNNLIRPPITCYIPQSIIDTFYTISCDSKLYNAPLKRFKLQNELLEPYGFKPLASGTNRRTFYCVYDPWIVLKIASDAIGRSDNISEFGIQKVLLPFCTKVFDVDSSGSMQLAERVEVMTEDDFRTYQKEICRYLESWFQLGYFFEDVGFYSFKNWGLRDGSGPVLLDFPYFYQYDPDKLICDRENPKTHEKCGGTIGYNYESIMSEIICYKCLGRYSAQYLSKKIDGNSCDVILGRKNKMRTPINVQVVLTRGNKVVYDPNAQKNPLQPQITIVPSQSQVQAQQPARLPVPQQQSYQTQIPWPQQTSIPVQHDTATLTENLNMMNSLAQNSGNDTQTSNKLLNLHAQQVAQSVQTMPQNQVQQAFANQSLFTSENSLMNPWGQAWQQTFAPQLQASTPAQQNSIEMAKDYELYERDGKAYIFYPKPLKNDMIQWLRRVEVNYGTEAAIFVASRLLIEYIPKAQWDNKKPEASPAQQSQQRVAPIQQAQPAPRIVTQSMQPSYQTINMMTRPSPVQTVIAPQTKPTQLKVEDPNHWNNIKNNVPIPNTSAQQVEQHPTSGLEIMKLVGISDVEKRAAVKFS